MGYQLRKLFKIELEYLLKVCSASINYLWTSHLRDWIRVVAPVWVTKTDLGLDNWKIGCLKSLPVFFHGLLLFFFMVFEVLSCLFMAFKVSSCLFFMVFEVSSGLFHGLGRVLLRTHICFEDKFNVVLPWKVSTTRCRGRGLGRRPPPPNSCCRSSWNKKFFGFYFDSIEHYGSTYSQRAS